MTQVYLSDVRESLQADIMRIIEQERPDIAKLIKEGDAEGDIVEIAIGEYYSKPAQYKIV